MTIETRLAEIRARVDAAADLEPGSILHALISTTHTPALLAAVEAVMKRHRPVEDYTGRPVCDECWEQIDYEEAVAVAHPCPTVRAITDALEVEGE